MTTRRTFLASFCRDCAHITISDDPRYAAKVQDKGCPKCRGKNAHLLRAKSLEDVENEIGGQLEAYLTAIGDVSSRPLLMERLQLARLRYVDRKEIKAHEKDQRRLLRERNKEIAERKAKRKAVAVDQGRAAMIAWAALEEARSAARASMRTKLHIECPRCLTSNKCSWNGYGRAHCRSCRAWWVVQKQSDVPPTRPVLSQLSAREIAIREKRDPAYRQERERAATEELQSIHAEWKARGRRAKNS